MFHNRWELTEVRVSGWKTSYFDSRFSTRETPELLAKWLRIGGVNKQL